MSADLNANNPDEAPENNLVDSPAPPSGTGKEDFALDDVMSVDAEEDDEALLGEPDPAPAEEDADKPNADNAPAGDAAKADDDTDKPEAPPTAVAIAAAKARADNLQKWATKGAQENAELKRRLAALEAAPAASPPEKKPAAATEIFTAAKFAEIEAEHGTTAAIAELTAWTNQQAEDKILGKVTSMMDSRKVEQAQEDAALDVLTKHDVSKEAYAEMQMHHAVDKERGFISPPAWLFAQQIAGGPESAVQIIIDAIAGEPAPAKKPTPGGAGRKTAKSSGKGHPGANFGGGDEGPDPEEDSTKSFESKKASLRTAGFA